MRQTLSILALLLCCSMYAQDQWQQIFRTDPYLSNGYFIVNQDDWQQLNLSHIDIGIQMATLLADGSTETTTLQQFSISDNFYGKADLGFLSSIQSNQKAYYTLTAYDQGGNRVLDYEALPVGGTGPIWPEVCRETCNAPSYAWTLHLFTDNVHSQIALWPAYLNGSYFYFYVLASDWQQFTNMYTPADFDISATSWDIAPIYAPDQVIHFFGGTEDPLPTGARGMDSYLIPAELLDQGGYAVAKMMGPWALGDGLETNEFPVGPGESCGSVDTNGNVVGNSDVLRQRFITDPNVIAHLNGRPTLTCDGMISLGGGSGFGNDNCTTTLTLGIDTATGALNVVGWVLNVINCHSGTLVVNPEWVHFEVDKMGSGQKDPVLKFNLPGGKDPKLVPVPKTLLEPGLYEFTLKLEDGSILHRYADFSSPVVINADFAAFTNINIYPVPVKDSFAVDFDLLVPMDIDMTVLDNMGNTFYQKTLHFTLAGRNKHVVEMQPQWPDGLYHAIFQYADGSSESLSFTVAQ